MVHFSSFTTNNNIAFCPKRVGVGLGWRPGPCPLITTPRFRCGTSLRGLRPNEFLMGFISIRVAIFYAGSPNLPQPSSFTRAWDRLCWDDSRKSSSQHRRSSRNIINDWRYSRHCPGGSIELGSFHLLLSLPRPNKQRWELKSSTLVPNLKCLILTCLSCHLFIYSL